MSAALVSLEEISLLHYYNIKKAALVLRAVNNELRQQLIELICQRKKICVTDVYVALRLEQSAASQHLAILRRAGIVLTEREGKSIFYSINESRIAQINQVAEDLLNN